MGAPITRDQGGGPPTINNPQGRGLAAGAGSTLAVVTIIVGLRLWGRYRYTNGLTSRARIGEQRFWVFLSDLTIVVSFLVAIALTAVLAVGIRWGEGIHGSMLTPDQNHITLKMFFVYQVVYKFGAGISKIATCFLLLAISAPQMTRFNAVCKIMAVYIMGYCVACSIATIFQCDLDLESNWVHTNDQSHCFPKAPFWFTHAALNIFASVILAGLPWWLFYYITYQRKYLIATLMTLLSVSEVVLGAVRMRGLYISLHSSKDLTYGTVTGILVSQLEVNFGIMSACIPTVLRILEEFLRRFLHIDTSQRTTKSGTHSQSRKSDIHLSAMDRSNPRKDYSRFDKDEEVDLGESTHSSHSRANIIPADNEIRVETSFAVESNDKPGNSGTGWHRDIQGENRSHSDESLA